jgi:hypothetical protein
MEPVFGQDHAQARIHSFIANRYGDASTANENGALRRRFQIDVG